MGNTSPLICCIKCVLFERWLHSAREQLNHILMHIVMFTSRSPWNCSSQEAIDAERATHDHLLHMSEIKGWTSGRNITSRDITADFVVIGQSEKHVELNSYIIHSDHQKGVIYLWSLKMLNFVMPKGHAAKMNIFITDTQKTEFDRLHNTCREGVFVLVKTILLASEGW